MKAFIHTLIILGLLASSCTSTPLPRGGAGDPVRVPEDFFGMVHAGSRQTDEEYQILHEMGVRWILDTFYWDRIENADGVFNFSHYDGFVDAALAEGFEVIAILAYDTSFLESKRKSRPYIAREEIPLFLNYVEETVRHFQDRVSVWGIWNEPNFMFWGGTNREFYELSRRTAEKIRETHSEAYILGGGFWRSPGFFIRGMARAGGMEHLDGLAFHPYAINPQGSMRVHDRFLRTLSSIGFSGSVWITEVGYPTGGWYPTRVSLEDYSSYVVKTISGAAARGARALLWYELFDHHNLGEPIENPRDSEQFFGLLYPDYSRKDAAWAYELCARLLPGTYYMEDFIMREVGPDIVSLCFSDGEGSHTLILWNDRPYTQNLSLDLVGPALVYDINTGQSRPLPPVFEVGPKPLIITWEGSSPPRLYRVR
ncbi:MAG: beta-galactosidase [Treponema sp.]|nr:beta-galactosidase [Treponema sp.]